VAVYTGWAGLGAAACHSFIAGGGRHHSGTSEGGDYRCARQRTRSRTGDALA
jgi:hypothetical protein